MKKLAVINGLRGYAILGVIYFHLIGAFFNLPGFVTEKVAGVTIFPLSFLGHGWLGVDLFFILSGFVLYLPYASGSRKLITQNDLLSFYKNRAVRLLPLYFIVVLISIIFIVKWANVQDAVFWRQIFLMFTFTFNFTKDTFIPQSNYVLWSLGIEILFSVIFPVLIWMVAKMNIKRAFLTIFYMSLIVRMLSCMNDAVYAQFYVAPHLNMIKDSILGRLDDFAIGMLLAHWFINGWKQQWFEKNSILLFAIGIVILWLGFNFSDYVFLRMLPVYYEPLTNTVFQLGFALLTVSLLNMNKNALRFLFTNKFVQLSGMMCYSLYLWHGNMRMVFMWDYTIFRIVCYFGFLYLLSFLTYRYIEFGNKKLSDILP